ncbi:hypothetical protein K7X08_012053 [Anisodus acutangulus]|uniref:Uncharacterized protein n=1 Tax=Anisodus acutangulus TaxID=402998 RepID=A0A9Q1QXV3_9SOLA|nr:hypothetical protein K7X08_012053 [Anisodus acutangulus]
MTKSGTEEDGGLLKLKFKSSVLWSTKEFEGRTGNIIKSQSGGEMVFALQHIDVLTLEGYERAIDIGESCEY